MAEGEEVGEGGLASIIHVVIIVQTMRLFILLFCANKVLELSHPCVCVCLRLRLYIDREVYSDFKMHESMGTRLTPKRH